MQKYLYRKLVKDKCGRNWRWLFGEWSPNWGFIELSDHGEYLKSKDGEIFIKCGNSKHIAFKKDRFLGKEKQFKIYLDTSENFNIVTPSHAKGFPPTSRL